MSRRIVELAERARAARPDIENLKPAERRIVIQMILMDEPAPKAPFGALAFYNSNCYRATSATLLGAIQL